MTDWRATFARIRSALMRRGQTPDEADDLVQEAFVRYARYEKVRAVARPEAFVMRAAINLSVDAFRAKNTHGVQVLVEEAELVDAAPTAEAILLARERVKRLSEGMTRLNDKTRQIFLAHRMDGLTYQEIARVHHVSISTVEKHVARATLIITSWMEGW